MVSSTDERKRVRVAHATAQEHARSKKKRLGRVCVVYTIFVLFHLVGGPQPPAKKFYRKKARGKSLGPFFLGAMSR